MAQHCFLLWPDPGEGEWVDSDEGGLFAYLCYRAAHVDDHSDVDVGVQLVTPATPVDDRVLRRQLWAPPSSHPGTDGLLVDAPPLGQYAREMRTAVYLGSTGHTLVHRDDARHFQVCRTDLNRDGDAVAHMFDYVYRVPGDILTFFMPRNHPSFWRASRRPPRNDRMQRLYRALGRGAPDWLPR